VIRISDLRAAICVVGLLAATPASAQSSQSPGYGSGNIDEGLVVGVAAGVAAVAGIGIAYLVLHNRGVIVGCVAESGGKKTLTDPGGKIYSLLDGGPSVSAGDRMKLKGHTSGPSSTRSFQVVKVLKDYGHCQP
jgi:hypothetical protein